MKQLLIVKSSAALNGGADSPKDLSGMTPGAIGFFALNNYAEWLSSYPTSNFAIALGMKENSPAFVIPEVDINTLRVNETSPADGVKFNASITIPSPISGRTYTLVLVKLGTGINGERNKWSQTFTIPSRDTMTAAELAKKFRDGFAAMADSGSIDVEVAGTGAQVIIKGKTADGEWTLKAGDDLFSTEITETLAQPAIGDKAYVEKLARFCAGNKGFLHTDLESQHIYPGYPEEVEDTKYSIFNLRFAVGRDSAKQTDERIWQYVHIAVPVGSAALSSIRTILNNPVLANDPVNVQGMIDSSLASDKAAVQEMIDNSVNTAKGEITEQIGTAISENNETINETIDQKIEANGENVQQQIDTTLQGKNYIEQGSGDDAYLTKGQNDELYEPKSE